LGFLLIAVFKLPYNAKYWPEFLWRVRIGYAEMPVGGRKMRWFRSHLKLGSWCALFALTVQLVVAFGHGHRADSAWPSSFLQLTALTTDVPAAAPNAPAVPSKPIGVAFDYCAICAVMNLAASAVPAAAPGLPVPIVLGQTRFWTIPEISLAEISHLLFRARAPPLA
jgi:hypothetical protein